MNVIILAGGLGVLGLIIGYLVATMVIKGGKKRLLEESNQKADLAYRKPGSRPSASWMKLK